MHYQYTRVTQVLRYDTIRYVTKFYNKLFVVAFFVIQIVFGVQGTIVQFYRTEVDPVDKCSPKTFSKSLKVMVVECSSLNFAKTLWRKDLVRGWHADAWIKMSTIPSGCRVRLLAFFLIDRERLCHEREIYYSQYLIAKLPLTWGLDVCDVTFVKKIN